MNDMKNSPSPSSNALAEIVLVAFVRELPAFLTSQRWYADKHRTIESVSISDYSMFEAGPGSLLLAIAEVRFADGTTGSYFVPALVSSNSTDAARTICTLSYQDRLLAVVDAVADHAFHQWLIESIRHNRVMPASRGRITSQLAAESKALSRSPAGREASFDQSNSSILFEDSLLAKVYRRLSSGANPDVEIGRFLTNICKFPDTPQLIGAIEHRIGDQTSTLIMLQEQLLEPRDTWSLVLEALRKRDWETASIGESLGNLTGRLHLAMVSKPEVPGFAARPAAQADVDEWKQSLEAGVDHVARDLSERMDQLDENTRELSGAFLAVSAGLRLRSSGFDILRGYPLIRVHGDYHLGQVLQTAGNHLYIVDFEGEPQRPIAQRRAKTSPLKDVAGMLRSFSYARAASLPPGGHNSQSDLIGWERTQRNQFIGAYLRETRRSGTNFLPIDAAEFTSAVTAWELDKALYEVMYEMSSRPTWLWLPLSSIVTFA